MKHLIGIGLVMAQFVSFPASGENCSVVHPKAMTFVNAQNNCGNNYYRTDATGAISNWHDQCYWPISQESKSAKQPGIFARSGWLASVKPKEPVFRPFTETDVAVVNGWMYGDGTVHAAVDFARGGETFPIRAVADGVVIYIASMPSPGNVLILEHAAPDGGKFRTIYHHVRNGRDNDIALARLTIKQSKLQGWGWDDLTKKQFDYVRQYQKDADDAAAAVMSGNTTQIAQVEKRWGTNAQGLNVAVGQKVVAGQMLGWAGTTGFDTTGVHLHIMFAKEALHRKPEDLKLVSRWTFFDPFGLYAGLANACYQGDYPTGSYANADQHPSIFAPVFQDYQHFDYGKFQLAFDYFAGVGWFPSALSLEYAGNSLWVNGSFSLNAAQPVVRVNRTFSEHQSDVNAWIAKGWRPDRVVGYSAPGEPRYAAIYAPIAGVGYDISHKMSADAFNKKYAANYATMQLTDFSIYTDASNHLWLSGIWLKDASQNNGMYFGLTLDQFNQKNTQMKAAGLQAVQVQKYNHPGIGVRYAGLWRKTNAKWVGPFVDLTESQWRGIRDFYEILGGYRVSHVTSYQGLYTLILTK